MEKEERELRGRGIACFLILLLAMCMLSALKDVLFHFQFLQIRTRKGQSRKGAVRIWRCAFDTRCYGLVYRVFP